jgi:hypothetical protein
MLVILLQSNHCLKEYHTWIMLTNWIYFPNFKFDDIFISSARGKLIFPGRMLSTSSTNSTGVFLAAEYNYYEGILLK